MGVPKANQRGNWRVSVVAETGSTNADLLAEGENGAPDRTVLRAEYQSAGRGRLDRTWDAPSGANLLVSFLFRPVPERPGDLTRAVGLAAVRVMSSICGIEGSLKWPNDILIAGKKAGGILAQAGHGSGRGAAEFVVVGLGLNMGWAPDGATSLSAAGWSRAVWPHEFCVAMLPQIDELLSMDHEELHTEYRAHLSTLGSRVRVHLPSDKTITGRATDVDSDGRLIVIDECAVSHRFDTADVVHLRADGR